MNPPQFFGLLILLALPFATLMARMSFRHKERMAELKGSGDSDPTLHARLERIEQSVEAIAIEVERISEGQRFLTRLAGDGLPSSASLPRGTTQRP